MFFSNSSEIRGVREQIISESIYACFSLQIHLHYKNLNIIWVNNIESDFFGIESSKEVYTSLTFC